MPPGSLYCNFDPARLTCIRHCYMTDATQRSKDLRRAIREEINRRDQSICMRYLSGETLRSIAKSVPMSIERVRVILKGFGLNKRNAGLAIRNRERGAKAALSASSFRIYGCPPSSLRLFTDEERHAFLQHRKNVKRTGTSWQLTLPEWVDCWQRSQKWAERGRGASKYGLCRIDPSGPYSVDNIQVIRNYFSILRRRPPF